jgi:hypothetical protein
VQRSGAIPGFVLLFGVLAALLVFAGTRGVEHPTAAEAFFAKYQQRAPLAWDSGRVDYEALSNGERTVTTSLFDDTSGRLYAVTYVDGKRTGEKPYPPAGSNAAVHAGFIGTEVKLSAASVGVDESKSDWGIVPDSIRFRDDPRARALGAKQLVVEFASQKANQTNLTQLLMIDAKTYKLVYAETSWGAWDPERQTWAVQTFRRLTRLNEPVDIPALVP